MDIQLAEALADQRSLVTLQVAVVEVLARYKADNRRVFYVAGAITADGDDKIPENIQRLMSYRADLAETHGRESLVFASPSIFTSDIYERLRIFEMPRDEREDQLRKFFDTVIESKHLDGIYFTPGWERSIGAKREYETALRVGVPITLLP